MPWQDWPKKDVAVCDKPREGGKQPLIRGFPNGKTQAVFARLTPCFARKFQNPNPKQIPNSKFQQILIIRVLIIGYCLEFGIYDLELPCGAGWGYSAK